jgi:hypothetical protein
MFLSSFPFIVVRVGPSQSLLNPQTDMPPEISPGSPAAKERSQIAVQQNDLLLPNDVCCKPRSASLAVGSGYRFVLETLPVVRPNTFPMHTVKSEKV